MNLNGNLLAAAATLVLGVLGGPSAFGEELGPGLTPVACQDLAWKPRDPTFAALPGARAFFGTYSGGSFRQHLVEQGFAWAASSYRCNGPVPGIGLLDTIALKEIFTKANAGKAASRSYLIGASLGGWVTVLGMQEFPDEFDGALAMCAAGPDAGNYTAGMGAAFEAISGIALAEIAKEPGTARLDQLLGKAPELTQRGRQMASVQIAITGGPRPFAMEGLNDSLNRAIRSAAPDRTGYFYPVWEPLIFTTDLPFSIDETLGMSAETFSARLRRKAVDPQARKNARYEETLPFDGRLKKPLMTLHGLGDFTAPVQTERDLKRAVDAAGASALLVQRLVRVPGHCGFSAAETIRSFHDLVQWVRVGKRPDGEDVLGDLRDAGKKFTDPARPGDPGTLQP